MFSMTCATAAAPAGGSTSKSVAFLEVLDQCAVKTVENGELRLVDLVAAARAPAQHLHPEDAGFHRAQEDDELQAGMSTPVRKHVHRDHDLGLGPVAELADLLQRPVHVRVAGDLLHKVVALVEDLAADLDELVGVRGMGQVVDGKDQDLGEAARLLFVLVGIACDFLDDLAVAVRRGDVPSICVDANSRSSSSWSKTSSPVSVSMTPTCSPSFRNTPFMRTSELILTAS